MNAHSFFITAKGLSFQWADGRSVFSGLDFSLGRTKAGLVGDNGVGKSTLLKLISNELIPSAGQIERAGRLSILPQDLVQAAARTTSPISLKVSDALGVSERLEAYSLILAGDSSPTLFDRLGDDWGIRERCEKALAKTGLRHVELERDWASLSCGERMRVLFGRLLLEEPDVVLLDEPTNHLDRPGRDFILHFLREFTGGVLVISHDRELLNEVQEVWELTEKGLKVYGGGFEFYREARDIEQAAARNRIENARSVLQSREQELRAGKERQLKRMAKGKKVGDSGGMPRILQGTLKRKAQETLGKTQGKNESLVKEAKGTLDQARDRLRSEERIKIDVSDEARLPEGKIAIDVLDLSLRLPGEDSLLWKNPVSFRLRGTGKLALTGPNGSGKTSLLRELMIESGLLEAPSFRAQGTIKVGARIAYLDQTVSFLDRDGTLLDAYSSFAPHLSESERRIRLARFLFAGEKVHTACRDLSGGERMRAGLLCLLSGQPAPSILIMDEPTNNLDLSSLETLEEALRETEMGLLVVSHDERFLDAIGIEERVSLVSK